MPLLSQVLWIFVTYSLAYVSLLVSITGIGKVKQTSVSTLLLETILKNPNAYQTLNIERTEKRIVVLSTDANDIIESEQILNQEFPEIFKDKSLLDKNIKNIGSPTLLSIKYTEKQHGIAEIYGKKMIVACSQNAICMTPY